MKKINWADFLKIWTEVCSKTCPKLMEKISVELISTGAESDVWKVRAGFVWICKDMKENLKQHLLNDFVDFLNFYEFSNKGILHTIYLLFEAQKSVDLLASIWIQALLNSKIYSSDINSDSILKEIDEVTSNHLRDKFRYWYRNSTHKLPSVYEYPIYSQDYTANYERISNWSFYKKRPTIGNQEIKYFDSYYDTIEWIANNLKSFIDNYEIVWFDNYANPVIGGANPQDVYIE